MKNTWIELDAAALARNIQRLREVLAPATTVIFVVKSNAYGHGLIPVARCAWACGIRWFAVAHVDEALPLRALLPEANILLLSPIAPAEVAAALAADLTPVLTDEQQALALAAAARARGQTLSCHAKIDTGMGRLGFFWEEALEALPRLAREPGLQLRGLCTHFSAAGGEADGFTDEQARRFQRVAQACAAAGISGLLRHASNSSALLCDSAWDLDGVRPGILLYGYAPPVQVRAAPAAGRAPPTPRRVRVEPCLAWRTRIVQVKKVPAGFPVSYDRTYLTPRETHLAVLDVGYADGYSRQLSNRAEVVIGGRRRPVVGRVTMNLTVVDLGPAGDAAPGDTATLLGRDGAAAVWADEMAAWRGTIPYEVLTNIRTDDIRVQGET